MSGRPRKRAWNGARYVPRRKVCFFCAHKVGTIDYKDSGLLRQYISDRGKIQTRRKTGVCSKHQHILATAIKRARQLALLPYAPAHIYKMGDIASE